MSASAPVADIIARNVSPRQPTSVRAPTCHVEKFPMSSEPTLRWFQYWTPHMKRHSSVRACRYSGFRKHRVARGRSTTCS